jgi:FAD-dependent urate hydroxylase
MTTKALVIGGGIGGLSTTLALQRAGLEAHVVEGANGLREIGAGVMIWANAVKALDQLGLSDSLHRITSPLHVMQTRTIDGRVLQTIPLSKANEKLGYDSVGFHRRELLQLLADAVDPASVHVGARFVRFEQDGTTLAAFLADGREVEGSLLIGADGIFSTVRQQLFPDLDPRYAGYVVWRGVAHLTPGHGWPPHSVVRTMGARNTSALPSCRRAATSGTGLATSPSVNPKRGRPESHPRAALRRVAQPHTGAC